MSDRLIRVTPAAADVTPEELANRLETVVDGRYTVSATPKAVEIHPQA